MLAERSGFVVPVCYALLPNKKNSTYVRMLELLCEAWPQMNPKKISLDFEIGIINAFRNRFPDTEMNGCFFHLVENSKEKVTELCLSKRYNTEPNFALAARMIPALAFVPPEHIDLALTELAPELPEELMPVLNYFEDNHIGRLRMTPSGEVSRRPARFPISTWNVYKRTLDGEGRTKNYAEAAHRKLQGEFGVDHPSLWRFIGGIRRVQHSRDVVYARYLAGFVPQAKRCRYLRADERILKVVDDLENRSMFDYLRGLARNASSSICTKMMTSSRNPAH